MRSNLCCWTQFFAVCTYICIFTPAVDPLLLECTTDGSRTHVTIDCQSNRPPVRTMCSFDGGLEHQCKWLVNFKLSRCPPFVDINILHTLYYTGDLPISVNLRTFTPGNHTLRIIITDTVALTAQNTIEYLLENDTRPSNCEWFTHIFCTACIYFNTIKYLAIIHGLGTLDVA